jgi:hypothetical protein
LTRGPAWGKLHRLHRQLNVGMHTPWLSCRKVCSIENRRVAYRHLKVGNSRSIHGSPECVSGVFVCLEALAVPAL